MTHFNTGMAKAVIAVVMLRRGALFPATVVVQD